MTRAERQKQANEIRQGIENDVEDLASSCEFLLPLLMNGQAKMGGAA